MELLLSLLKLFIFLFASLVAIGFIFSGVTFAYAIIKTSIDDKKKGITFDRGDIGIHALFVFLSIAMIVGGFFLCRGIFPLVAKNFMALADVLR